MSSKECALQETSKKKQYVLDTHPYLYLSTTLPLPFHTFYILSSLSLNALHTYLHVLQCSLEPAKLPTIHSRPSRGKQATFTSLLSLPRRLEFPSNLSINTYIPTAIFFIAGSLQHHPTTRVRFARPRHTYLPRYLYTTVLHPQSNKKSTSSQQQLVILVRYLGC